MKLLPPGRSDLLEFIRAHITAWQQDPAAIGLSEEQVADLAEYFAAADAAFRRAKALRDEAQAATLESNTQLASIRTRTAAMLKVIKAFAGMQEDNAQINVYAEAQIAEPIKPGVLPAPGEVRDFRLAVTPLGQARLTWRPPHPQNARERAASSSGLIYEIGRRLPGERAMRFIAAGKMLEFTDEPLPAGSTTYSIRAVRGDQPGPWHVQFAVNVGMGAGAVGNLREVRMAA